MDQYYVLCINIFLWQREKKCKTSFSWLHSDKLLRSLSDAFPHNSLLFTIRKNIMADKMSNFEHRSVRHTFLFYTQTRKCSTRRIIFYDKESIILRVKIFLYWLFWSYCKNFTDICLCHSKIVYVVVLELEQNNDSWNNNCPNFECKEVKISSFIKNFNENMTSIMRNAIIYLFISVIYRNKIILLALLLQRY